MSLAVTELMGNERQPVRDARSPQRSAVRRPIKSTTRRERHACEDRHSDAAGRGRRAAGRRRAAARDDAKTHAIGRPVRGRRERDRLDGARLQRPWAAAAPSRGSAGPLVRRVDSTWSPSLHVPQGHLPRRCAAARASASAAQRCSTTCSLAVATPSRAQLPAQSQASARREQRAEAQPARRAAQEIGRASDRREVAT